VSDLPTIPEAISNLGALQFLARQAVAGTLSGFHRSGLFGSSVQFAEHKPYTPGEDLRHIDWKVLGKMDRLYVKKYEDDTNARGYLVVDASSSMNFGSGGHTKFQYAAVLGATIAYLFTMQQDLIGLVRFGKGEIGYIPPRGRMPHFQFLSETLMETRPTGEKKLTEALSFLLEKVFKRSVILVLSDFLVPIEQLQSMARVFRANRHDVYWLQLLDAVEVDFPFSEWAQFRGLEGEEDVTLHAREAARSYKQEVGRWIGQIRDIALENHIQYRLIRTDEPVPSVLPSVFT
jgi:uncharacterized protein (DUF58 family)